MLHDFLPVACFPATVSLSRCSQPRPNRFIWNSSELALFSRAKDLPKRSHLSEAKTNSRFNKRMTNSPEYVVV